MSKDEIDKIMGELESIKKLLMGNGAIGVAQQTKLNTDWITRQRSRKDNVINTIYKIVISIILLYIAREVGLG